MKPFHPCHACGRETGKVYRNGAHVRVCVFCVNRPEAKPQVEYVMVPVEVPLTLYSLKQHTAAFLREGGMSDAEIAGLLHINRSSVSHYISFARKKHHAA